jgi:hypothetical protein
MGLARSNDGEARFRADVEGAHERDRACGPGQATSRLLLGFDDALRAQERSTTRAFPIGQHSSGWLGQYCGELGKQG